MAKDILEVFTKLIQKFADFFDILDLSFFIAGVLGMSAFYYGAWAVGFELPFKMDSATEVLIIGIACYGTGLLMFAAGRQVRRNRRFAKWLSRLDDIAGRRGIANLVRLQVHAHALPSGAYDLQNDEAASAFYTRCWAELRQDDKLKPSLALVLRYWVLAATYDGVAIGCLLWAVTLFIHAVHDFATPLLAQSGSLSGLDECDIRSVLGSIAILAGSLVLLCIARPAFAEAEKYQKYQVKEVIATLAHKMSPLLPPASNPPSPPST